MISWAAAKQIRWVKPSMTTVSPSCTCCAIASRIVTTLLAGCTQLGQDFVDDVQAGARVVFVDDERRCDADGALATAEQQQPLLERVTFDVGDDQMLRRLGGAVLDELDAYNQPGAAHVTDLLVLGLQLARAFEH